MILTLGSYVIWIENGGSKLTRLLTMVLNGAKNLIILLMSLDTAKSLTIICLYFVWDSASSCNFEDEAISGKIWLYRNKSFGGTKFGYTEIRVLGAQCDAQLDKTNSVKVRRSWMLQYPRLRR